MDYPNIFKPVKNHFIPGLSFDQYGMAPGVNNSLLKSQTCLEMWYDLQVEAAIKQIELTEGQAHAYAQGELIHKLVLEPDLADGGKFLEYFQYSPTKGLTTQKAIAAFEASPDKPLITPDMMDTARWMRDNVWKHRDLAVLMSRKAEKELTGFAWDDEFQVRRKIRCDFVPHDPNDWLLDLKSTSKGLSKSAVFRTAKKLGYGMQAAYYLDTYKMITGRRRPNFVMVFMSTEKPYLVRPFYMDDDDATPGGSGELMHEGRSKYLERLTMFKAAAGEFERRVAEKHPHPEDAWEGYENEPLQRLRDSKNEAWY